MGEHRFHIRSCATIHHPAALDDPPQPIGESKRCRRVWFARSHALKYRLRYVALVIPIGDFTAQDLTILGHSGVSTAIK